MKNLTELEGTWGELKVSVSETDMVLSFPFNEAANFCLKQIEGHEYYAAEKCWSLPITEDNHHQLEDTVAYIQECLERAQAKAEHQALLRSEKAPKLAETLQSQFDNRLIKIDYEEGDITVSFPYHAKALGIIRKIDGRRWDGDAKAWYLPADQEKQIRNALKALSKLFK